MRSELEKAGRRLCHHRKSLSHWAHSPAAPPTVTKAAFLANGNDRAFRQMVHDSLAFAARLEAIRDGFARLIGLTGVQYTILIAVNHRQFEQKVSVSGVAAHLHLSGAFITNETNKLVRLGLLVKEQDPDDGRRLVLRHTTPEAQDRLAQLAEVQGEVNDEHFAPLGRRRQFRNLPPHDERTCRQHRPCVGAAAWPDAPGAGERQDECSGGR